MQRTSEYKKLINSTKWIKVRTKKITNDPLCQICKIAGIIKPAVEIHHMIPIDSATNKKVMEQLCYEYNNLQSLCHECHVKVHIDMKSKSKDVTKKRNKDKTKYFADIFLSDKK